MSMRIMMVLGLITVVLALVMLARVSHTDRPPLSPKPLGTSTLNHGGPPAAQPSTGLPDQPDDDVRNQGPGESAR
jgi:hypothetical protein